MPFIYDYRDHGLADLILAAFLGDIDHGYHISFIEGIVSILVIMSYMGTSDTT